MSEFKLSSMFLPYQKRIFDDPNPFKIMLCSRQIGKSFTLAGMASRRNWTRPKNLIVAISTGERAAKELLLKVEMWSEAIKTLDPTLTYKATATSIEYANGSRIITLPSNNTAALRGYSGDVILDEFALVENDVEIWRSVAPIITNNITGDKKSIWIASTPTSLDTQFAKIWFSDADVWSKYKITIHDAVKEGLNVDVKALKAIVDDDLLFRVEYECEFASDFNSFVDVSILKTYDVPPKSRRFYLGWDVGRKKDLSIATILCEDNGKRYLTELIQLRNTSYAEQLSIMESLNRKYRFTSGFVDAGGIGSMLAEEAHNKISALINPLTFTGSNKTPLYEQLRADIFQRRMFFNPEYVDVVKTDFNNIRRVVTKTGVVKYTAGHSSDGHSDITSSLVLALDACIQHPSIVFEPATVYRSTFGRPSGIFARFH